MVDFLSSSKASHRPKAEPVRGPAPSVVPLDFHAGARPRAPADLARMIESEIIPRLMLAHAPVGDPSAQPGGAIGPRIRDAFARMTLANEAPAMVAYLETLMQGGVPLEDLYIELLIPTARRLGDDWNEDVISFTEVTIGLSRLQQVVRSLGRSIPSLEPGHGARSACFVPAPGEQHAFGLFILEDYFRRAGWRTWLDTAATRDDAGDAVRCEWFDVFGLSATSDMPGAVIADAIAYVRRASLNPDIFVMVGGRLFLEHPALVALVGADGVSETAADALSLACNAIKPRAIV